MEMNFKDFFNNDPYPYDEIEVINMYSSGSNVPVREIAQRTNKSIGEVYRILQRHHVNPNRTRLNYHNVYALSDSGVPTPTVADMTGYSIRHVRNIIKNRD